MTSDALALANRRVMRQDKMLRYIAYVLTGDEAADPQQAADGVAQALAEREEMRRQLAWVAAQRPCHYCGASTDTAHMEGCWLLQKETP